MKTQELSFNDWQQRAADLQPESRALISGEFVEAKQGQRFLSLSPIDGQSMASVVRCQREDVDAAVISARQAYQSGVWRGLEPSQRKAVMLKWAQLIHLHKEQLALLETLEVGKPISDTLNVDVPSCANAIVFYAECADKLYEEIAPTGPLDQALIKRMPLGVVAAIVPWNYPMIIAGWKMGAALVVGNSVVLKPAEQSSLASLYLAELALQAGIPAGVLNVVPGYGHEAGAALAEHDDVDLITFTGSTVTGRKIMSAAAQSNLKRVALELGGKSPQIVMDDCPDLDAAASAIAWSIYYNQGQTCHAGSRVLVHQSVASELYEKIISVAKSLKLGHPLDPASQLGALVEAQHLEKVQSYIQLGQEEGAQLLMGGQVQQTVEGGSYLEPTLLVGVKPEYRVAREEIFGPVLVAIEIASEDEALAVANNSDYGLAASVWTADINRAHRMSEALCAGTVWINTYDASSMATPFGGFKQSGFGRDRSLHALDKYSDLKTVWTRFSA